MKHHLEKPLLRLIQRLETDGADTVRIVSALNTSLSPEGFSRIVVEALLDDMERRGYIAKEFVSPRWCYKLLEKGRKALTQKKKGKKK